MRTRRSPRNQERLWRELGEQGKAKPVAAKCCWNCANYPGGRARGYCKSFGGYVRGGEIRPCFVQR